MGASSDTRPPRCGVQLRGAEAGGQIGTKLQAIAELQKAVRARLGLAVDRNHGKQEPCAWNALFGSCTKKDCQCCAGGLKAPGDLLKAVKGRCGDDVLRVKRPKEPG